MKVSVEKNMLSLKLLVHFEVDEYEFAQWRHRRFGEKRIGDGYQVGEALYLLSEFYKDQTESSPIDEVQVEVLEPVLSLPPSP